MALAVGPAVIADHDFPVALVRRRRKDLRQLLLQDATTRASQSRQQLLHLGRHIGGIGRILAPHRHPFGCLPGRSGAHIPLANRPAESRIVPTDPRRLRQIRQSLCRARQSPVQTTPLRKNALYRAEQIDQATGAERANRQHLAQGHRPQPLGLPIQTLPRQAQPSAVLQREILELQPLGWTRKRPLSVQPPRATRRDARNHNLGQLCNRLPRQLLPNRLVEIGQRQPLRAGPRYQIVRRRLGEYQAERSGCDPRAGRG